MSQQSIPRTLGTFLSDLVEIREKKGVTLDDIRISTKVYPHIIAQFEDDGLNEHPLFNKLYLKAFVRSYASVVDISLDLAVESYEAALAGRYKRELAVKYLGHELSELVEVEDYADGIELDVEEVTTKHDQQQVLTKGRPAEKPKRQFVVPKPKKSAAKNPDWNSISERLNNQWGAFMRFGQEKGLMQWVLMAGGIGLIALVLVQVLSLPNREIPTGISQSTTPAIQEASVNDDVPGAADEVVDSLVLQKEAKIASVLRRVEEGDSLSVMVVARTGKLDPFRVKLDGDLRRPYWLDSGDSMSFRMGTEISIEDNLQAMEILFESLSYPIYSRDTTAKVIITRDSAQAFLQAQLN